MLRLRFFFFIMAKIKNTNFYTVHGWMINDLGLASNELLIFSIIYGFSQDGSSEFTGSMNYLADFINSTRPTVSKCLKNLTDKGFLIKTDRILGGQNLPTYRAVDSNFTPCKDSLHPCKDSLQPPCKDSLHNNNNSNNNSNTSSEQPEVLSYKSKNFTKWTREDLLESIKAAAQKRKEDPTKPNFTTKMLNEFFNYWIADHKSGKMYFLTQDKWGTMQRLVTWQSRENGK